MTAYRYKIVFVDGSTVSGVWYNSLTQLFDAIIGNQTTQEILINTIKE